MKSMTQQIREHNFWIIIKRDVKYIWTDVWTKIENTVYRIEQIRNIVHVRNRPE